MKEVKRPLVDVLNRRLKGPKQPIQIVLGPRQVGKTTALEQVIDHWDGPSHYATADLPAPPDASWIQSQWEVARQLAASHRRKTLLVLDEVQKVTRWSEVAKAMYDRDKRGKNLVRVVVLGSSALHVERGAKESLAGRYELHFCPHWTWPECRNAFGWSLEQWLFFGGYPGAAPLSRDLRRWRRFVTDSLVEPVLGRDVMQLANIHKPALMRQLFMLSLGAPAQVVSFNKMLGQLTDAGNTVTLAHYLELLSGAFLVSGINLWSAGILRSRASSPKLIAWNNALLNAAASTLTFTQTVQRGDLWGRLVENAVGAHFLNHGLGADTYYWQDGGGEVDFIVERGGRATAFEVKSGRKHASTGLERLKVRHPKIRIVSVGSGGIPLERFFETSPDAWL